MVRFFAISDIHIRDSKDPSYRKLLDLIAKSESGDLFFLGGDIFDFLVGNQPSLNLEFADFFTLLEQKSNSGVRFVYVEGNHDFHLQFIARRVPKVEIDSESFLIDFCGKKFYLAHGDLVDQSDYGYLALRFLFRSLFIRLCARLFPDSWVSWIGEKSNIASKNKNPRLPEDQGEARVSSVRKKFREFSERKAHMVNADFIVMGHCHDLDESDVGSPIRQAQYINIGYPKKHGKYVYWEKGMSRMERRDF